MDNAVVQVQFINYLLNNETLDPVFQFNIDESYFPGFEKEFNFIIDYYNKTKKIDGKGRVPDKVTFSYHFPDFPLFETNDAINTMYKDLLEQKLYAMFVEVIKTAASKSKESSFEAIEYTKNEIEKLFKLSQSTLGEGTEIISAAKERLDDYLRRVKVHGMLGIPTGLKSLDEQLHGWLPEDFVVIIARTNEGKSWLLLYFMLQAWLAGKKVAVYSGEMSALMYGFRFDTLYKHFSNKGLIAGDVDLGDPSNPEVGAKSMKEYQQYIESLLNGDYPDFRIFTQKDFNGKMNVNHMKVLQDKYGFDIWGIDQLSLMSDVRKAKETRFILANISEDLFHFTEEYQIPVIAVHQANRRAVESRKKNQSDTPELEHSAEADAIAQNSTRFLSMAQVENGAKLRVLKNRYGQKGQEFLAVWNINFGIFKEVDIQSIRDNLF